MLSRLIFPLLGLCFTSSVWAQICNEHIPANTPTDRFIINADNTATDTRTGLIWKRCLEGVTGVQCEQGSATSFTWQQALQHAANESGWRLPNFKELNTILELKCYDPAINLTVFPATPNSFVRSSSPSLGNLDLMWFINFSNGNVRSDYRDSNYPHIRLVRDTSSSSPLSSPQNVVTTTGDGQITLAWDAVNNANSYQITNEAGEVLATTITGTTYTFTGLTNNQAYSYRIAAQDATGQLGAYTAISSATPKNPTIVIVSKLNDTGITWGGNYPEGNNTTCAGETIAQQDCSHGRDATHDDDSDGHAGFSFTKIDKNGNDLPSSATVWACVRDNVTGFMWEVKQGGNGIVGDEGLHDADDSYSWYNTNMATNSGHIGQDDFNGATCHAYQKNNNLSYCNTEAFLNRVNQTSLCGHSDWSIPNRKILRSIVDYSRTEPAIDTNYFPATKTAGYWSSSPNSTISGYAWYMVFSGGYDYTYLTWTPNHIRLVRGGQ